MMPVSKKRAAAIAAIAEKDIDTTDIPEADAEFFKKARLVTNMAKKEQSPLSKLSFALSSIDALLAIMDDRNYKQLITKAQERIEEATEVLIVIKTTLGKL